MLRRNSLQHKTPSQGQTEPAIQARKELLIFRNGNRAKQNQAVTLIELKTSETDATLGEF